MGFGHVGSVASIYNYAMAERHFNDTKEHTRCKGWQSHERCLKSRASGNRHYRLEKHNDGEYYDVCLYSTVMARYYRPDENGHRRVLYAGHGTQTSKSFQWRVLGVWEASRRTTTDNRQVVVPLYRHNCFSDRHIGFDKFCVDLTLDEHERLIVEKSKHAPHYTHKSNDEDKALRKRIKDKFANFIMLAQLRMPEFRDNVALMQHMGRPFAGGNTNYNMRMSVESLWEEDKVEEHWLDHFFDMCQDVYDTIASKRGYEQGIGLGYRYGTNNHVADIDDLEKQVTEKDLEKAILTRVFNILGANNRSEAVLRPQFMAHDEYPRSTITPWAS